MEQICGLPTAASVFLVRELTNDYRDIELRWQAVEAMGMETRDLVRLLPEQVGIGVALNHAEPGVKAGIDKCRALGIE